ncbi:MAG TPA: cytochrome-c peroxidase, partial [Burkholderiales bacterium]|nr:cytochrome-c peroxidase [Burkholderiales bacterium]
LRAFEVFEQSAADFYPYSSKYDAFLAGKATLTDAERHGLELFNDETKGNCASCHISQRSPDGAPPQFTDFGLIALGVPRNRTLSVNGNPRFYDLGACGPQRTDLTDKPQYCGLFKTPTLRNVALRQSFFHNGVMHSLDDAVRFYVERDTRPQNWYSRDSRGRVQQFDDLPPAYRANVNVEAPFGGQPGDSPALSEAEIRDVVAFLKTLTDGYQPATAAAETAAAVR